MSTPVNINDASLYRNCHKKQYEVWMCIPPYGTAIVNKFEQFNTLQRLRQLIPQFKTRDFLTTDEVVEIRDKSPETYKLLTENAYIVNRQTNVVLCGTEGEMWVTSYQFVCNQYQMFHSGAYIDIPNAIQHRSILRDANNTPLLSWCKVRTRMDYIKNRTMALFVPKTQVERIHTSYGAVLDVNTPGIKHGKGDFIVCESFNGVPNLQNRWVVNGLVFSNTYNNRGWEQNLVIGKMDNVTPEELFDIEKVRNAAKGEYCTSKEIGQFEFTGQFVQGIHNIYVAEEFSILVNDISKNRLVLQVALNTNESIKFGISIKKDDNIAVVKLRFVDETSSFTFPTSKSDVDVLNKLSKTITSNELYKRYYGSISDRLDRICDENGLDGLSKSVPEPLKPIVYSALVVLCMYCKEHAGYRIDNEFYLCADDSYGTEIGMDSIHITVGITSNNGGTHQLNIHVPSKRVDAFTQFEESLGEMYAPDLGTHPKFCAGVGKYNISYCGFSPLPDDPFYEIPYEKDMRSSIKDTKSSYNEFCKYAATTLGKATLKNYNALIQDMQNYFDSDSIEYISKINYFKYPSSSEDNGQKSDWLESCRKLVAIAKCMMLGTKTKQKLAVNRYSSSLDNIGKEFSIIMNCENCALDYLYRLVISISQDAPDTMVVVAYTHDSNGAENETVEEVSISNGTANECADIVKNWLVSYYVIGRQSKGIVSEYRKSLETIKTDNYNIIITELHGCGTSDTIGYKLECKGKMGCIPYNIITGKLIANIRFHCNFNYKNIEVPVTFNTEYNPHNLNDIESNLSAYTATGNIDTGNGYDILISILEALYGNIAYKIKDETIISMLEDIAALENITMNIDYLNHKTGYVYISMKKWFSDDLEYIVTTINSTNCIIYSHPERITRSFQGKKDNVEYKRVHYHGLLIRLGLLSQLVNFRELKLKAMEFNRTIFDDMIPHDIKYIVGNYVEDSNFKSFEQYKFGAAAAYSSSNGKSIFLNANFSKLQHDLDIKTISILLHEMCHLYTYAKYGTYVEEPGEGGDVVYGLLSEDIKDVTYCHGKRFGEAVELVVQRNKYGFSFGDIFSYGVGHPRLTGHLPKSDNNIKTLHERNAFNIGQDYRQGNLDDTSGFYCANCGKFNCNCQDPELIEVGDSEYLGVCNNCGKVHKLSVVELCIDNDISLDYIDKIDEIGLVAITKCECGGELTPKFFNLDDNNEHIQRYMNDFNYCQRLKEALYKMSDAELKYQERYFKNNLGCTVECSMNKMPCLQYKIVGDSYEETYKLFIASNGHRTLAKLYRDYGLDAKGYLIHTFRLNGEKDARAFIDYMLMYIRKDGRQYQ